MNWLERKIVEGKVNAFLKSHWPAIMAVAGGAVTFLIPSLTAYEASHEKSLMAVVIACFLKAYYAQSPIKPKQ